MHYMHHDLKAQQKHKGEKMDPMQLVIFDLDGVIVSTDAYHYQAWLAVAQSHQLLFNPEVNHHLRGVSRRESLEIILAMNAVTLDAQVCDALLEQKNTNYQRALEQLTPADLLPGVMALISELKCNGIRIAIGSSSRNTPLILEKIGLKDVFDAVVDGNQIEHSKPHPEVFLKCAEYLEVAVDACVVFEDAQAGVAAALTAGMRVVGVGTHHAALHGAHSLVESLEQVNCQMLRRLFK